MSPWQWRGGVRIALVEAGPPLALGGDQLEQRRPEELDITRVHIISADE